MSVVVRPLREADLDRADQVMRIAFGTFLGLPDPSAFGGDAEFVRTRCRSRPEAAFALEVDGVLAGSNFATRWGSFGFVGPLSIHPDFWDRGFASLLMEPIVATLDAWGLSQAGLFTFPHSPKHIGLYQKHGFRAQSLNLVMGRPIPEAVEPGSSVPSSARSASRYSALSGDERDGLRQGLQRLCSAVFPGLDPCEEIDYASDQKLGDTVSISRDGRPVAFALAHVGTGSEAGSGVCALKLAVLEAGRDAEGDLGRLLDACEELGREIAAGRLQMGINAANTALYESVLRRGFRIALTGIAMQRPNRPGFCTPDRWVMGDWR